MSMKRGRAIKGALLILVLMVFSCAGSEKIIMEESLTGVHEIRPTGFGSKSYEFSTCVISDMESLKGEELLKDRVVRSLELSFNVENSGDWSGSGTAELNEPAEPAPGVPDSSLSYQVEISRTADAMALVMEMVYDPAAPEFNGFLSGTVQDGTGSEVYRIYSSRNLNFYTPPSEGVDGFTIRENQEILATVMKSGGHWAAIYNVEEDYPEMEQINAVISTLFVILEKGRF